MLTKAQNQWVFPIHIFRLSGIYTLILDQEMDRPLFFGTNTAARKWINKYLADASLIFYYRRAINATGGAIQNVTFKNYASYEHNEKIQSEEEVTETTTEVERAEEERV